MSLSGLSTGGKIDGTDYVADKHMVDRHRSAHAFIFVAHHRLPIDDVRIQTPFSRGLVGAVAVDHHFKPCRFLINRLIPLNRIDILALMRGINSVLPVKKVDFDTGYSQIRPLLQFSSQNVGIAVGKIG